MNLDELTESLHATTVVTPLDVDRITRDGARIRNRHRVAVAGGLAAALVAVAVPVGWWQQASTEAQYAAAPSRRDDPSAEQRNRQFRARAPLADPVGAVVMPGGRYAHKFYLSSASGGSSVGGLSLWAEQDGLAFGPRDVDGDGALRRAGSLDLAPLDGPGQTLARVPWQPTQEPTFVGLIELPDGTTADDLRVRVTSEDALVGSGIRTDVVPGKALLWVNATEGRRPGTDLSGWSVRLADGTLLGSGGFEPAKPGSWAPLG